MAGVALLHSVPEEGTFLLEALRTSGHRVELVNDPATAESVAGADVILADLDVAIAAGWVRPANGAKPPRLPLIVASPHEAFLDVVRHSVAATLLTPATPAQIDAAVQRARSGEREPTRPTREPDDTARDAELARRGMTSDRVDPELLGIASLVARSLDASIALITVVDSKRQVFVGHAGLPIDFAIARGTVRDWSFCQHAMTARTPLVVPDAMLHPFLANTFLVESKMVRAYAGAPIEIEGLGAVGTVCVLSDQPREFAAKDLATLELGAKLAAARLERRGAAFDAPPPPQFDDGALHVGELVGDKYWLTASLGRGGQSEVFLARDRLSGQMVAIKSLRDRDEQVLLHEAEALTRLRHPNIVQLHGWGRGPHDELYLVLEYVEGVTLAERITATRRNEEPLSLPFVAETIRQLAGALASMHAIGFVHGDVKPNNVIIDRALDRAVLIDFGFPLAVGSKGATSSPTTGSTSSPIIGGTPGFSAPEQFVAAGVPEDATQALDVYSLAAVAYAMITGEGPFADDRGPERIAAQLAGRFPLASSKRGGLPSDIDELLASGLAGDPAKRPASVLDFADELERLIAHSQPTARPALPRADRPPSSRGIAFRHYRLEVRRREGIEGEARIFAQLPAHHRAVFESVEDDDAYYPADALIAYLAAYGRGDEARLAAFGYDLAWIAVPDALKSLHVTRTPETLLYAADSLLHRFHDWGRIAIERPTPGVAHVEIAFPKGYAPVVCHYFVGLERALLAMTGRAGSVEHDACVAKGGDVCRFIVTWASR